MLSIASNNCASPCRFADKQRWLNPTTSLNLAPVVGPLGSVPAVGVGYADVFRRDPTRHVRVCGLCHI